MHSFNTSNSTVQVSICVWTIQHIHSNSWTTNFFSPNSLLFNLTPMYGILRIFPVYFGIINFPPTGWENMFWFLVPTAFSNFTCGKIKHQMFKHLLVWFWINNWTNKWECHPKVQLQKLFGSQIYSPGCDSSFSTVASFTILNNTRQMYTQNTTH